MVIRYRIGAGQGQHPGPGVIGRDDRRPGRVRRQYLGYPVKLVGDRHRRRGQVGVVHIRGRQGGIDDADGASILGKRRREVDTPAGAVQIHHRGVVEPLHDDRDRAGGGAVGQSAAIVHGICKLHGFLGVLGKISELIGIEADHARHGVEGNRPSQHLRHVGDEKRIRDIRVRGESPGQEIYRELSRVLGCGRVDGDRDRRIVRFVDGDTDCRRVRARAIGNRVIETRRAGEIRVRRENDCAALQGDHTVDDAVDRGDRQRFAIEFNIVGQ